MCEREREQKKEKLGKLRMIKDRLFRPYAARMSVSFKLYIEYVYESKNVIFYINNLYLYMSQIKQLFSKIK